MREEANVLKIIKVGGGEVRGANYEESEKFIHFVVWHVVVNSLTLKCVKELLVDWGGTREDWDDCYVTVYKI